MSHQSLYQTIKYLFHLHHSLVFLPSNHHLPKMKKDEVAWENGKMGQHAVNGRRVEWEISWGWLGNDKRGGRLLGKKIRQRRLKTIFWPSVKNFIAIKALPQYAKTEQYLSSSIPTPPIFPHPSSFYDPLETQWYDFIPPPTEGPFNPRPHFIVLAPWFRDNKLCFMVCSLRRETTSVRWNKGNAFKKCETQNAPSPMRKKLSLWIEGSIATWCGLL